MAEPESKGVVACGSKGRGSVLWYVGESLRNEIEEAGLSDLGDLGLDNAPHGISVWVGTYAWSDGSYEYPNECESYPVGTFRSPTDDEWQAIRAGHCPWPQKEVPRGK